VILLIDSIAVTFMDGYKYVVLFSGQTSNSQT